ncbi:MAG: class B sortase, partial [Oscillospiraceae bacterium]|nr:class B sortase [Oscillospiraceae bacterium]
MDKDFDKDINSADGNDAELEQILSRFADAYDSNISAQSDADAPSSSATPSYDDEIDDLVNRYKFDVHNLDVNDDYRHYNRDMQGYDMPGHDMPYYQQGRPTLPAVNYGYPPAGYQQGYQGGYNPQMLTPQGYPVYPYPQNYPVYPYPPVYPGYPQPVPFPSNLPHGAAQPPLTYSRHAQSGQRVLFDADGASDAQEQENPYNAGYRQQQRPARRDGGGTRVLYDSGKTNRQISAESDFEDFNDAEDGDWRQPGASPQRKKPTEYRQGLTTRQDLEAKAKRPPQGTPPGKRPRMINADSPHEEKEANAAVSKTRPVRRPDSIGNDRPSYGGNASDDMKSLIDGDEPPEDDWDRFSDSVDDTSEISGNISDEEVYNEYRRKDSATEPGAKKKQKKKSTFKGFLMNILPWAGDSGSDIMRKIIAIASAIVLIGCLAYFGNFYYEKWKNGTIVTPPPDDVIDITPSEEEIKIAEMKENYPHIAFPENMAYRWMSLYSENQHFAGWIKIDNMNVNNPVMQSGDNKLYLDVNFNKETNKHGTLFADYRNDLEILDKNTIIYGHNMKDGTMFGQLKKYREIAGYKSAPLIVFDTLYETHYYKVFAVFLTNSE